MANQEKIKEVAVLKEKIAAAKNIIVTDHTSLTVEDMTVLRRDLRRANSELRVAKNTLFRIAAREAGKENLAGCFVGPTSLVLGYDDPAVPARIIFESNKKIEKPKVKAFILDNQILGVEDFKKIAQLPPREVVLAQLIGSIEGPIVNFIMTLEGVVRNFIGLVDALAEKNKK